MSLHSVAAGAVAGLAINLANDILMGPNVWILGISLVVASATAPIVTNYVREVSQ